MSEPFKPDDLPQAQNNNNQDDAPLKKHSHLRLVVSNPEPMLAQEEDLFQDGPDVGFTVKFYKEGVCDVLKACDHFHRLRCRMLLEIDDQEAHGKIPPSRSVICNFPHILGKDYNEFEELNNHTKGGEDLFGMILIQFQMKLLEQMLLFASDHDASTLVIHTNNAEESDALGLYQRLAAYVDKVPTDSGAREQLVIPINQKTFDKLIDLIDEVNQKFRRGLWREQRNNLFIRRYLKRDASLEFFC